MQNLDLDFSPVLGKKVLVALSGGADSVALLALLRQWGGCELLAAHFEHGIRGLSSRLDADFCRGLCAKWEVPYFEGHADVPAEAARLGVGLETAARDLRYAFLRQVKADSAADCIALAHHLDDQAETVLMHLSRGAGSGGMAGMRVQSGDLFRPLLGVRKAQLTEFLAANDIPWREDETNARVDTPRNGLRLHIIPALERLYPDAVSAMGRQASLAAEEDDCLEELARKWLDDHMESGPYGRLVRCLDLPHPAIFRRALRRASGLRLNAAQSQATLRLAQADAGALQLPGGVRCVRARGGLYLQRPRGAAPAPARVLLPGTTRLEGICTLHAEDWQGDIIRANVPEQTLDRAALTGAVLRTRRDGDRIRPLGMRGTRLLSDYLTDRHVDAPLRDTLPLLAREDRILWVPGVGISADAAARPDQPRVRVRVTMISQEWNP